MIQETIDWAIRPKASTPEEPSVPRTGGVMEINRGALASAPDSTSRRSASCPEGDCPCDIK